MWHTAFTGIEQARPHTGLYMFYSGAWPRPVWNFEAEASPSVQNHQVQLSRQISGGTPAPLELQDWPFAKGPLLLGVASLHVWDSYGAHAIPRAPLPHKSNLVLLVSLRAVGLEDGCFEPFTGMSIVTPVPRIATLSASFRQPSKPPSPPGGAQCQPTLCRHPPQGRIVSPSQCPRQHPRRPRKLGVSTSGDSPV